MYLYELAKTVLKTHLEVSPLDSATRFTVTSCPWLKGRILRWSQGGVTVKYDIPNKPWNNDHKTPEADEPEGHVGNYTAAMSVSRNTEVTPQ